MARKRTYKILLSDEDKKILNATIHNKKTCKMTIRRCQILLELDENAPNHLTQMQIAKTFGVSKSTVSNIVSAYVDRGIPAIIKINRNPRSNAKRKIDVNNGELVPSARSNCTTLPKQEYRLAGWLYRSATALCQRCEPLFR